MNTFFNSPLGITLSIIVTLAVLVFCFGSMWWDTEGRGVHFSKRVRPGDTLVHDTTEEECMVVGYEIDPSSNRIRVIVEDKDKIKVTVDACDIAKHWSKKAA